MTQPFALGGMAAKDRVTDLLPEGTVVHDDHRWMEDWTSPRFAVWLEGEAERSRTWFDACTPAHGTAGEVAGIVASATELINLQTVGGWLYLLQRAPGDRSPILVRHRGGSDDAPVAVLDPAKLPDALMRTLAPRSHVSIDWYTPSPTGEHIAVGLSVDGSEDATLIVIAADGQPLAGLVAPRAYPMRLSRANAGGVSWTPAGDALCYLRLRDLDEVDATARYQDGAVCLRSLRDPTRETTLVCRGSEGTVVELDPDDVPMVSFVDGGRGVLTVAHASRPERSVYVVDDVLEHTLGELPWHRLSGPGDRLIAWCVRGDLWIGGVARNTGWELVRRDLASPERGVPIRITTSTEGALEDVVSLDERIVVRTIEDGCGALHTVHLDGSHDRVQGVPARSGIASAVAANSTEDASEESLVVLTTSWMAPPRVLRFPHIGGPVDLWPTLVPDVPDEVVCSLDFAVASDGVRVPITLLSPAGAAGPASPRPLWLVGYGYFGITLRPQFTPLYLAWIRRGGLVAIAHIRGGGDRGDSWYRSGSCGNKERGVQDFLDVAAHLVERGLTRPKLTIAEGTSAGGLTVGGAMVRKPAQFAAVILRVSVTNTLRLEMHENGPPNVPEYGTVTTADGARALLISDVYSRVEPQVAYPPVLLTVGLRDPRVLPWQPAKLAARLQEHGNPNDTLLRVEEHGGHGVGSSTMQASAEAADRLSFALAHIGRKPE